MRYFWYCYHCRELCGWRFICDQYDRRGRRWEVYRCERCGEQRQFAVT